MFKKETEELVWLIKNVKYRYGITIINKVFNL